MSAALRNLLVPQRLTDVVDIGANPIDGEPPYTSMLAEGLCHVTGFEPQQEALLELQRMKGPTSITSRMQWAMATRTRSISVAHRE
jgi:hypothetical protein